MDNRLKVVEQLIETGKKFTFQNFCYPNSSYPGEYGGEDTSEWLEWKTRSRNLIVASMADDSPAVKLTYQAIDISKMS